MPAVRRSRYWKLGRRASVVLALLPLCLGAQGVTAAQVVAIGVEELHTIRFHRSGQAEAVHEPDDRTHAWTFTWTLNGDLKKVTVDAFPPVQGLRLVVTGSTLETPLRADLGDQSKDQLPLPLERSAGTGLMRYDLGNHRHTEAGECLVRFTITNF